ncbi:MAG: carboxypeptidase regulatory-like domain-containing protein, partial [Ferruginibacter sp.]
MCKRSLLTAVTLFIVLMAKSQTGISGKIVTKDGVPAANVNIEIKELKKYSTSNTDGLFAIGNISEGKYHIIVSFTGLLTQQQEITVHQNGTPTINFVLVEN